MGKLNALTIHWGQKLPTLYSGGCDATASSNSLRCLFLIAQSNVRHTYKDIDRKWLGKFQLDKYWVKTCALQGGKEKKQKEKLCRYFFKDKSLEKLNSQGNQSVEGKHLVPHEPVGKEHLAPEQMCLLKSTYNNKYT